MCLPYFLACQAPKRHSDMKTAPDVTQLHVFMPCYIQLTQPERLRTGEWLYWFSLGSAQPRILFLEVSIETQEGVRAGQANY